MSWEWKRIHPPVKEFFLRTPVIYALAALMVVVDYLAGPFIQFPVFYLIPVCLLAWRDGLKQSLFLSVLLPAVRAFISIWVWSVPWGVSQVVENFVIRVFLFGLMAFVIHRLSLQKRLLSKRLDLILEDLPAGVWFTDGEGKIVQGNKMGQKIWEGARYVGPADYGVYQGWWADTGEPVAAEEWGLARAIAKRERSVGEVVDIQCFDGSRKTIVNSAAPIIDEKGKILGAVVTNVDITNERRLVREKEALAREMEKEKRLLERMNRELDEFVRMVSHDLSAPVRHILAFAGLLLSGGGLGAKTASFVREIRDSAQTMTELINDLVEATKLSRMENPFEPADAGELVRAAIDRFRKDIEDSGVRVTVAGPLPIIECDRIKMRELFANLIGNAVKYSSKKAAPEIAVGYEDLGDRHRFFVRDNGIGIDPKSHSEIFEMFRRLHAEGEYEGTGAGLHIAKKIVEAHGGEIGVQSAPGEGSTFFFTIPKSPNRPGPPEVHPADKKGSHRDYGPSQSDRLA